MEMPEDRADYIEDTEEGIAAAGAIIGGRLVPRDPALEARQRAEEQKAQQMYEAERAHDIALNTRVTALQLALGFHDGSDSSDHDDVLATANAFAAFLRGESDDVTKAN